MSLVIDEVKMRDALMQVVDRAANDLRDQVIGPALAGLNTEVNNALTQISNVAAGLLQGVQGIEDKTAGDLKALIEGLDGWTVEVGPITIPAISIRLTKPKATE